MQKRLGNGPASSHSRDKSKEQSGALYRDGKLDIDAYFKFIQEYWEIFEDKSPREPIVIKNRKF